MHAQMRSVAGFGAPAAVPVEYGGLNHLHPARKIDSLQNE